MLKVRRGQLTLTLVVIVVAMALGAFVRLFVITNTGDFPLNDGGLFLVMIQDVMQAHFALPAFGAYNAIHMPFVYPPLAFYLAAIVTRVTHLSLLDIVRFMPAVVNILTIPAMYALARTILKSGNQAIYATFAFALLPRTFFWLIMGGGLTRSVGFFFAILALQQAYLLYTTPKRVYIVSTSIFSALTVLSHPEMTLYAAAGIAVFFVFRGRTRQGLINSILVVVGTLVLSALWWLQVISLHGITPFFSAFGTGEQSPLISLGLLLTGVGFVQQTLLGVIALLGAVKCLADRKYLLPVWLVSIFIVEPRSAQTFAVIVVALLIAVELDESLFPMLRNAVSSASTVTRRNRLATGVLVFMLIVYSTVTAMSTTIPVLAKEDRTAMAWVGANTPAGSKFVMITGYDNWADDATSEWFPVLSGRYSVATVQGYEWFPNKEFIQRTEQHKNLQACTDKDVYCVEEWAHEAGIDYSYIYISTGMVKNSTLQTALATSPDYERVYNGPGAVIFERRDATF
jgi:hypothetical protein